MALQNIFVLTETVFDSETFLKNTKNAYRLVSQRPYVSKKDPSEKGVSLTLQVAYDATDYGVDKKSGRKRDNNVLNTFDVTILDGTDHLDAEKNDWVRLVDYLPEKSYVIGFDVLLRFKAVQKLKNVQP